MVGASLAATQNGRMHTSARWTVIVPVKPVSSGKSRLALGEDFAAAVALDTIEAAAGARLVAELIVVTADVAFARGAQRLPGVRAVIEPAARGIAAAIDAGAAAAADGDRAVLLGDLPALRGDELDAALEAAQDHDRAFVPDTEGTGTTLVTARAGLPIVHAFGEHSAGRHLALGLHRLEVADDAGLRRDIDRPEQLLDAAALGLGPRTAALHSAR